MWGSIFGLYSDLSIYMSTFREFGVGVHVCHDLIYILNGSVRVENRRGHMWEQKDQFGGNCNHPGVNRWWLVWVVQGETMKSGGIGSHEEVVVPGLGDGLDG